MKKARLPEPWEAGFVHSLGSFDATKGVWMNTGTNANIKDTNERHSTTTHADPTRTAAERIAGYRRQIDDLDQALAVLLQERVRVARLLGEVKSSSGKPLRDAQREAEVLARIAAMANEPWSAVTLKRVFKCIMRETLSAEQRDDEA